jgi:hypothetical protein
MHLAEIYFGSHVYMLPLLKKHIFKILLVHIRILCVHAKVSRKIDTSYAPCKKYKIYLVECPILALKFVFFAYDTQYVNFSWNNIVSMYNGEIYVRIFVFNFFNISKHY